MNSLQTAAMLPEIGICIPTRNQAEFISDALRSAFAQTIAPCDVVVSDDAGTDETESIVEQFRQSLPQARRGVLRYSRSPDCLGIGGNFDRAVRLCRGEFVVKLDSDDMLEADFVANLAGKLRDNPKAGWAHCNVWNIHPDGRVIGLAHTRKKSDFYTAAAALPDYFRRNDTCHCVLLRKTAYDAVGGYRPEMKTCEDWLLWLEMLLAGWGYCFDEKPLARMRKYDARPELMSWRRTQFISSAKLMVGRLEILARSAEPQTKPLNSLLRQLRRETARLCICSGIDESNLAVRHALFQAACEFYPSAANNAWRLIGSRSSGSLTRYVMHGAGAPRRLARKIVQQIKFHTVRR